MGLDQILERNNKLIKVCGGASDLLNGGRFSPYSMGNL